mgnify:CR=1 FL=1
MQFGKVTQPELVDFRLPQDHKDTKQVLKNTASGNLSVYVGCAKWNRQDLKGFYPRGTKDELAYYSSQFNSIELNATFYSIFPEDQFVKWYHKTPKEFKFFPKLVQNISHLKRLNEDVQPYVDEYCAHVILLKDKLGTVFLLLHGNFDTAGRRDLLHMRLTNSEAFIRYVGANHTSDYSRLDEWVERLKIWKDQGISNIHFFVHQNLEVESPLLAGYFIKKLNTHLNTQLHIPGHTSNNFTLF